MVAVVVAMAMAIVAGVVARVWRGSPSAAFRCGRGHGMVVVMVVVKAAWEHG